MVIDADEGRSVWGGRHGPTETIGMLACWAADAIKDNYVRNPGTLV